MERCLRLCWQQGRRWWQGWGGAAQPEQPFPTSWWISSPPPRQMQFTKSPNKFFSSEFHHSPDIAQTLRSCHQISPMSQSANRGLHHQIGKDEACPSACKPNEPRGKIKIEFVVAREGSSLCGHQGWTGANSWRKTQAGATQQPPGDGFP